MSKIKRVLIAEFDDENELAIVEDDICAPDAGELQVEVGYLVVRA
jgi:hypothetical protein